MKRSPFLLSSFAAVMLSACSLSQPPAAVQHFGTDQGYGSAGAHLVLAGDTLYSLSKRYNVPLQDIAVENSLYAPFELSVGERVKIPPPRTYIVREGDTLYSISRVFGMTTSEIAQVNEMRAPYAISEGQSLKVASLSGTLSYDDVASAPTPGRKASYAPAPRTAGRKPNYALPPVQERVIGKPQAKPVRTRITAKTPPRSSSKFMKPVSGRILSSYGPKKGGLHNDGINIAAPKGAPVRAAENGVVVYAGSELKGSGNLVLVRHEGRWMSAYAHMDKILIKRGQVIKRGQTLGTVGQTGSVDTPQLHFEIRRGTKAVDPKRYIRG